MPTGDRNGTSIGVTLVAESEFLGRRGPPQSRRQQKHCDQQNQLNQCEPEPGSQRQRFGDSRRQRPAQLQG